METKDFKHRISMKVRFSDLDAMQHVNNAAYLTYLEEGRIAYFRDVLKHPENSLDFGAVIARIEIDYIQPIMLGDEIEVLTRVSKIGIKSSDIENMIIVRRKGKDFIAASAVTKLVSYDFKKLTSVPIKEDIKKMIEAFEGLQG